MSGQIRTRYDIIINGGGVVGFTLLNLIQNSRHLNKCRVLLIEQAPKPLSLTQTQRTNKDQSFSNRVSSITYSSKSAFKRLGVWDRLKPFVKDVRQIKVWNYNFAHKINFEQNLASCISDKEEKDIVFSTVENDRLSKALLERIYESNAGDKIVWSNKLVDLNESLQPGFVDVSLENEHGESVELVGSLILGCDGFKSKVRELTKMEYLERNLEKWAVVGTVEMTPQITNKENDVAYQRFSTEKDTVAAILPLDQQFASFVISAPEKYAKHLAECESERFIDEFNNLLMSDEVAPNAVLRKLHGIANATYDNLKASSQLICPLLGLSSNDLDTEVDLSGPPSIDRVLPGSRAIFPLIFGTTSPRMISSLPGIKRPQIALLGDASHRVHPLAGQGLNLGVQDAIELVRQLDAIVSRGENIFFDKSSLANTLKKYELKRQAYVIPMSLSILMMQDLFKFAPTRILSSLNKCSDIKTASVRFANGPLTR